MTIMLETAETTSPIGTIRLAARDGRLCALEFAERWPRRMAWLQEKLGPLEVGPGEHAIGMSARLQRYFAGELPSLDEIDVEPIGTPFQRRVWDALRQVPPGRTTSYGELARSLGVPAAARAVGAANGANPIAIVVPCHRAIGVGGALTGYAGGLDRKRWLLAHERAVACTTRQAPRA